MEDKIGYGIDIEDIGRVIYEWSESDRRGVFI